MKKALLILLLALTGFAFISCGDKDGNEKKSSEGSGKVAETKQKMIRTKFIYSGWVVYEEQNDGKMYATLEAEVGDDVQIYTASDGSAEQKKAIRRVVSTGEEKELEFIHIKFNNKDYWTRDIFVAPEGSTELYIALSDTMTYSKPDGISILSTMIKEGELCVANKFAEKDGYIACVIYDGNSYGKEIFVSGSSVTNYEAAVDFIKTYYKMEAAVAAENALDEKHYDETCKVINELATMMITYPYDYSYSSAEDLYNWVKGKILDSEAIYPLLNSTTESYFTSSYYDDDYYYDEDYEYDGDGDDWYEGGYYYDDEDYGYSDDYDYEGDYDYEDYDYSYDDYDYYDER